MKVTKNAIEGDVSITMLLQNIVNVYVLNVLEVLIVNTIVKNSSEFPINEFQTLTPYFLKL